MSGLKTLFKAAKISKLPQVFIVYVSSSAVILEVTDVLQNNDVLVVGVFKYVLWGLLFALPIILILAWWIRKRSLTGELADAVEVPAGPIETGSLGHGHKKKLHNLPETVTRFIGREKEKEELVSLLTENRLVTITGEGGSGKTSIALQVAREFFGEFPDGVWFVDMAPLEDPELVPQVVASALSISEEAGKSLTSTLIEQSKEKAYLLILDNCEHLLDAIAALTRSLLTSQVSIKAITTSREAMKIEGEVIWRIPSLSESEAILLFVDRAGKGKPGFQLDDQNKSTIEQICKQLEGIPLAIELAASRIRHMEPQMILDRLHNRFQILNSDSRALLSRQKTLKATIDWSYDLLSPTEQVFFSRLSVFSGGFLVESVEEICADSQMEKPLILDLLSSLVDKSMVIFKSRERGVVRYGLLETLRAYSFEKLREGGEKEEFERRHFEFFLSLAEKAYKDRINNASIWAVMLESEHDDYLKALKWAESRPQEYLKICGALGWFWESRSHYESGILFLRNALSAFRDNSSDTARALVAFGSLSQWRGDLVDEAVTSLEEALEIWTALGDENESAQLHFWLGNVKIMKNLNEEALGHFKHALSIYTSLGDPRWTLTGKLALGFGLVASFRPDEAEPLVLEALDDAIKYDMKREIGQCRHLYADCALLRKEYALSLARYKVALEAIMKAEDLGQAVYELQGMAMSLAGQSKYHEAFVLNSAALQQAEKLGIVLPSIRFWDESLEVTLGKARREMKEEAYESANKEGREMGFEKAVQMALSSF